MQVELKLAPLLNQVIEKGEIEAPFSQYGDVIRIARGTLLGISAEKLSEQTSVAPSTLSKMENHSATDIQMQKLLSVLEHLGIEIYVKLKKLKDETAKDAEVPAN